MAVARKTRKSLAKDDPPKSTPGRASRAAPAPTPPAPSSRTPRRPGRKSEPRKLTPLKSSASPETKLSGKSSPYFSKTYFIKPQPGGSGTESDADEAGDRGVDDDVTPTRRSARSGRSSGTRNGASTSKRGVAAKMRGRGKVAARRGGKVKKEKDRADATGLTETESDEDDSGDSGASEDDFAPPSTGDDDAGQEEDDDFAEDEEDEDDSEMDSDDLDDDDFGASGSGKKRKKPSKGMKAEKKARSSMNGRKGKAGAGDEDEDEDAELEDVVLEEGQEIAGRIYPAPKTGQVPPGQISQNTLKFLKNLQIPERNDRDWFRSHEPAFRQAEKEWQAFVGLVQMKFHEQDDQIPILPPKDLIHRIYRDIRFSSDKTPYKKSFSLSTSRGGRKGVWAGYHLSICPNDKSLIAAGVWCPGKNEMQTIRHHILTQPQQLRDVIGSKEFVATFGPAKPHPKGKRQNVFGHEDALKVAPKGVDKEHKDIDLLKLRSVAVVHHFSDDEVLAEDFQDTVAKVVGVMTPLVHVLNDFIALPP